MNDTVEQLKEFHWMMDMLQSIDVGLIVLDPESNIQLWNSFMENHSGLLAVKTKNKSLFELFPDIPRDWFQLKVESVFQLKTRAFSIWEQRPYIFRFKNYRPITGTAEFMYQNISVFPLTSTTGETSHVCIMVYDVTDIATNRSALKQANLQLKELSRTDRLTQLNNRGYWQECLETEFARYKRHGEASTLVMFDIDHFKRVNDKHGHQAGDEVIRLCARALLGTARDIDICGRYGGEEFVVILEHTNLQGAEVFAERLRRLIEKLEVKHQDLVIKFTVSLGVCELNQQLASADAWIQQADKALYESKANGRNRTTLASPQAQ